MQMLAIVTSAWARWVGLVIGAALLGGAVAAVVTQRATISEALAALAHPSPVHVAALLAAIVGNIVATGFVFHLLTSRYGRVGAVEMQAVIAATALVNYLPLRPGVFGRVAYHRAVNRIAVTDSVKVLIQATAISGVVVAYIMATALLGPGSGGAWFDAVAIALAPTPVLAILGIIPAVRVWAWASLARLADVLFWSVRYWAAFELIGAPIEPRHALIFACVSLAATLVPLVSNGLGLREWAIGLATGVLTAGQLELGITAELVNRAAEIAVVLIAGGASLVWLGVRRVRMTSDE